MVTGGSVWRWWRVAESGYGDRVDPVVRTTFGVRRKIPPENFSGGGGRNPVGEGGRRWGGMRGERERVDEDAKTVNRKVQIQAPVDGKKVIITEASVRRDLQLADENGTECLPNATIFAELERMRSAMLLFPKPHYFNQPLSLQPQKNQKPRKSKKQNTKVPQLSGSTDDAADKNVTQTSNDSLLNTQALEIERLKRRVKKLEKKKRSRTPVLKRLRKVGRSARIESSKDKVLWFGGPYFLVFFADQDAGLHGCEDSGSYAVKEVSTADPVTTSGEVVTTAGIEVSTATIIPVSVAPTTSTTTTVIAEVEITLAQTLTELKSTRSLRERGLQGTKMEKQQDLIKSETNTQCKMDTDYQLLKNANKRTRTLCIEEMSKLFVQTLRRLEKEQLCTEIRAREKSNKPPTKAQKRSTMSTYLKHMVGYKHTQLKSKSYDEIQKLFDKEMKRVNTFVDMDTELVEGSEKSAEDSTKRAGTELEQEVAKKQKIDDDQEETRMKELMNIVPDEEEIGIDAIPLAHYASMLNDWRSLKQESWLLSNHES
ncbi:hypothetical protein Tco_0353627 [Tanacetum coccineum]